MTKEITKAIILEELQDKFQLREFEKEKFLFSELVLPTYDIGRHVEHPTADYEEVNITAGPTNYTFFTVPQGERWHLTGYNVVFMAAGAYTVTGLYLIRPLQLTLSSFIYLDMTVGQTASYAINLPKPVRLDPNTVIKLYIDSYTSTAALRLYIDFIREEIR